MSGDYRDRENHRSLENRERIKIMVACNKLNWYAAYTRVNQELLIKRKLDELGIENFLPQEEQVRETPVGRKKIRVLLIHGLIFIRTDKATKILRDAIR